MIVILEGKEADNFIKKQNERFAKREAQLRKMGAKSTEGITVVNGVPKSIING